MTTETAAPVAPQQRIAMWDVLRGFAVLGIFIANLPFMALSKTIAPMHEPVVGDRAGDAFTFYGVQLLVDSKFVTIFSLLFGAGLGLMWSKAQCAGRPFAKLYLRRVGTLLLIGIAHGTLLWAGDILAMYAWLGALALLFRKCRVTTLLVWATVLLLLNYGLWLLFALGSDGGGEPPFQVEEIARTFASGDFAAMLALRAQLFGMAAAFLPIFMGMRTLALFLVGIALVKSGRLLAPTEHRRFFVKLGWVGLGVGLPLQLAGVVVRVAEFDEALWLALFYPGGLALGFGYVGLVALWVQSGAAAGLLRGLAAVGRMALTNYLLHSAVGALAFNYLGYLDQWSRAQLLLFAVVVFAVQIALSRAWLTRWRSGPVERVWRWCTYGR